MSDNFLELQFNGDDIMKESFYTWLLQFKSDATPVGDLARDAEQDEHFPHRSKSYKYLRKYLESKDILERALKTFDDAFFHYQKN